jgi:hypothetical protein
MSSRGASRRGRKRAQTSAPALPPLPTYAALLQGLSLRVEHVRDRDGTPIYELQVVQQPTKRCACSSPCACSSQSQSSSPPASPTGLPTHWRRALTLDEYTAFYQRLLAAMQHGHFCGAECPWIYSFVTSYFPKKSVFRREASARTVASRREALERCLVALQTFLLDRKNHACAVVTTSVAKVVAEFTYGGEQALPAYILELRATFNSSDRWLAASNSPTALVDALSPGSLSDYDLSDYESAECCGICARELCYGPNQDEEPLASPSSCAGRKSVYTTALGCGHQFHDECILPVLNETMCCPTCGHQEISC